MTDAPTLDARVHPVLDRPIWSALTTRQRHLARTCGRACMFDPAFSHFACEGPIGREDAAGFIHLVRQASDGVTVLQADPVADRAGLSSPVRTTGLQMVWGGSGLREMGADAPRVLGDDDAAQMQDLVALTEPGPFRPRTHHLGTYLGVKRSGQLVAMAGERLKPAGYTEISAVCVHPDYRGQSLARLLVSELVRRILAHGDVPFLHLYTTNTPALRLYESLGFTQRRSTHIISFASTEEAFV